MVTRLDMHCHTPGSDGTGTPEDFIRYIRENDIDGVVITDHHKTLTVEGLNFVTAIRKAGLIALIGCEYSTLEGHCLVYGCDVLKLGFGRYPKMIDLIREVHKRGGVAFPSHPYRGIFQTLGDRIFDLAPDLTHVEVFNGQNAAGNGWTSSAKPEANEKALVAAEKMDLGYVGGSDAHQPQRLGTCFTEFNGSVTSLKELVAALRARDHVACLNEDMVQAQRLAALSAPVKPSKYAGNEWNDSDSWSRPLPWSTPRDSFARGKAMSIDSRLPELDRAWEESYRQGRYEEDAGTTLRDEDIPAHAFGRIESPEDVQAFLAEQNARRQRQRR